MKQLESTPRTLSWSVAVLLAVVWAAPASAQDQPAGTPPKAGTDQATALAKQQQNPIASLISVPLQGNWDFGLGDRDATGTLFNFQPVMPFGITRRTTFVLGVIAKGITGWTLNSVPVASRSPRPKSQFPWSGTLIRLAIGFCCCLARSVA